VSGLTRAFDALWAGVTSIGWGALTLAVSVHLVKTAVRARAWRNVLTAAYPDTDVRWRSIWAAYASGVGVNSLLPARAGDVVRLYVARRAIPGATYPTLASSLLVEVIFDSTVALLLLVWALKLGVLPGLDVLPRLPALDWLWIFDEPRVAAALAVVMLVFGFAAGIWASNRVEAFWARVRQGVAVLRTPRRYLRTVVPWQALDWCLRLLTLALFLHAFDVPATARNALLTQVTQSISTALPITPAGIGTEQALLVYVFRGDASTSAVLSFSVGMKVTLIIVNIAIGAFVLAFTFRTFRLRRAVAEARAHRTADRERAD
jgi:uncharacterized membrane protein YbhN (UPF0104 family)